MIHYVDDEWEWELNEDSIEVTNKVTQEIYVVLKETLINAIIETNKKFEENKND